MFPRASWAVSLDALNRASTCIVRLGCPGGCETASRLALYTTFRARSDDARTDVVGCTYSLVSFFHKASTRLTVQYQASFTASLVSPSVRLMRKKTLISAPDSSSRTALDRKDQESDEAGNPKPASLHFEREESFEQGYHLLSE